MRLQCFYVYEAPHLTIASFNTILESCPNLKQFGNLSRWAVNCEGIQQIGRAAILFNCSIPPPPPFLPPAVLPGGRFLGYFPLKYDPLLQKRSTT
jgi:hypothetical protein